MKANALRLYKWGVIMMYYKIKPEHDNKRRRDGSILIANELYTQSEMERYNIPISWVDVMEISKSNIYISFGARFEKDLIYSWKWSNDAGGYCLQLPNNNELQMFIDDTKEYPVVIFQAWYSFDKNENRFGWFGKYKNKAAANKAIKKMLRDCNGASSETISIENLWEV